ncbi:MAG: type III pantothenate kinase [Gammaproteobacteria bacterium]|nr:type III pantothenate kinase [Gammaproteobacteria bacterium]
MILCLDVGNSQLLCGVYDGEQRVAQFRRSSIVRSSSDELGVFLCAVLRENGIKPEKVRHIAMSSVVPDMIYSMRSCCQKYFDIDPLVLKPGVKTGLKILYRDPKEVGADRIGDAMGALKLHPDRNLIIVDFGTATTITAVTRQREFLGGAITPGVRIAIEALASKTAQLPLVEIVPASSAIGRSTIESIQNGIYWSNVGMIRELTRRITAEAFEDDRPLCIATGGFSHLFDDQSLFDAIHPDLILVGLHEVLKMNDYIND